MLRTLSAAAVVITASTPLAAAQQRNIVATAEQAGGFDTLTTALDAAGWTERLKTQGPYTVFAPTDEAFAALPEGVVEVLLKPENRDQLEAILTYHVIPGAIVAGDFDGMTVAVTTVQGEPVTIDAEGVVVMVEEARVLTPDIRASNGVIHVIDMVLVPPE